MQDRSHRFVKESFAEELEHTALTERPESLDIILARGSKSFAAASKLLPKRIRRPATALYAFCRIADDVIDEADDGRRALDVLNRRLDDIYAGSPFDHPVDRAFCEVAHTFGIPKAIPLALFEGFEWDNAGRVYDTLDDTLDYCVRVASTVGVMMTLLIGPRRADVLARACDLGLAMQLTNICRDVGEDADSGRIYLPREWLAEAGIRPDDLIARPLFTPALGQVVSRVLDVADHHYALGDVGISLLPRDSRIAIRAASLIYADIGRVVRKNGCDSITTRAHTRKLRKVWLALRAMGSVFWRPAVNDIPAHPSVRILLDAVDEHDAKSLGRAAGS